MAEARRFGPLRVRAFLTSLFIIAWTFFLSVVATVTMPLSPRGELYLWFAQVWPKVIFAVGDPLPAQRLAAAGPQRAIHLPQQP